MNDTQTLGIERANTAIYRFKIGVVVDASQPQISINPKLT